MAHPARADRSSADSTVLGVVLLVVGCGWLAQAAGIVTITWPVLLSVALMSLGVALVFTARRSTSALVVVLGVVMAAVLASTTTTINLDAGVLRAGAGDRDHQPTTAAELDTEFATAAGTMVVDLGRLDPADLAGRTTKVRARIGFGDLRVLVPTDVAVRVDADAAAGEVVIFGGPTQEGVGVESDHQDVGWDGAEKRVHLHLSAIAGRIEVVRAR